MMLMTKFGKFKLRLVATINLSVLLSLFNIASTTSNYWLKHTDHGITHYTGLLRSCHTASCFWRNGILNNEHSLWSILVRLFLLMGTLTNIFVVVLLIIAFVYKLNKKSKVTIRLMEWANFTLLSSFLLIFVGFIIFISNKFNYSMWLHAISMIILIITSNMLTRTFSSIYFQNTRLAHCNKSCDTAVSNAKLSMVVNQENECKAKSIENLNEKNEQVTDNKDLIEMNQIQNEQTQQITDNNVQLNDEVIDTNNGQQNNA
ncbi:unnamed protein product [Brachionus calyciflorus]|uniref:Transmembrane protein n=1 Tax=Brachionus calyciflorus TaxID=104777 RepID=A0A813Y6X3_9BILA|nr:unnamed protein product [Brachionus calyciflorus]